MSAAGTDQSALSADGSPPWWNLRGRTGYRVFGALILDDLCVQTDLSTAMVLRQLRAELHRPLSRQSLAAWRRGDRAAPNDVMLATATVVRRTLAEAAITVVMRVLSDPDSDPSFAEGLRFYYARGRPEMPPEVPPWLASQAADPGRPRRRKTDVATPLWRNLRGKTVYRVFAALILDELCSETALNIEELRRRVRAELRRPLSRQTLAAWRRGDQSVPNDLLLATGAIVRRTLAEASLAVALRVMSDPHADPRFAAALRSYHAEGRLEMPPEALTNKAGTTPG
jgi:hypothetical protein